jgi:Peptidase M15
MLAIAAGFLAMPAAAEFRFSGQTSLLDPDPFVRPKPPAPPRRVASVELKQVKRESSVAEVRLAAFPGHMPIDAVARLTLDSRTLKIVRQVEIHFAQSAEILSGCRTDDRNLEVGGAPRSFHLSCLAADIQIKGVSPEDIRNFVLTLPGHGGVGTYCGFDIVHIDSGPKRQWHRPCGVLAWHEPGDWPFAMR